MELLVVITIMSILVGLLMPAVQSAREAARQTQCQTNLKQLSTAMLTYHNKYGSLPLGTFADSESATPEQTELVEDRGSCLHLILPYIGMESLYNLFHWKETSLNKYTAELIPGTTTPIYGFRVPSFVCPSEDYRGLSPDNRALSSYVGCSGPREVSATGRSSCKCPLGAGYNNLYKEMGLARLTNETTQRPYPAPGCFMQHYSIKKTPARTAVDIFPAVSLAQIRDGEPCTILMAEIRPKCTSDVFGKSGWTSSWNGCGIMSTLVPINYDSCNEATDLCKENGCSVNRNGNTAWGYKSAHPGGAYFSMVDTSVHFLSEGIDSRLYQLLGAIDDGRPARVPSP